MMPPANAGTPAIAGTHAAARTPASAGTPAIARKLCTGMNGLSQCRFSHWPVLWGHVPQFKLEFPAACSAG
jgi:hypothetical protein